MPPISPKMALEYKEKQIPEEVFDAFNELIAEELHHGEAVILQKDAVNRIFEKLYAKDESFTRQKIFDCHYLDVEAHYRKAGWKVEYDKPAYCESYEANFTFSVKTKRARDDD